MAVGPLLRCRLHTAVRWEWEPVARRTWSATGAGGALLVLAATLLVLAPGAGLPLLGLLTAGAVLETTVLHRLTSTAVSRTTGAAGAP